MVPCLMILGLNFELSSRCAIWVHMSNSESHASPSVPETVIADSDFPVADCGLARAARLLGDRWMLLILRQLFYGAHRFEEMREALKIPKSVLSTRLSALIEAGLVETRDYREAGSRTRKAYYLSTAGEGLGLSFLALLGWGNKYFPEDFDPIHPVDATTRRRLKLMLVDAETGERADLTQVKLTRTPAN